MGLAQLCRIGGAKHKRKAAGSSPAALAHVLQDMMERGGKTPLDRLWRAASAMRDFGKVEAVETYGKEDFALGYGYRLQRGFEPGECFGIGFHGDLSRQQARRRERRRA